MFRNLLEIKKLDPENGRVNYNICVLRFFMWQYASDTSSVKLIKQEIESLPKQGVSDLLVQRLQMNYYIMKCEDQMKAYDYKGKDSSLAHIRSVYDKIQPTDVEIYSLANFYSFYSNMEWAQEIIEPRISSIDVDEDLVFYYLNLLFYHPSMYDTKEFYQATLNAINLNVNRFCKFFKPSSSGGASMQLLEYPVIKKFWCAECAQ